MWRGPADAQTVRLDGRRCGRPVCSASPRGWRVAMNSLEAFFRAITPTENFWGWVLIVGASFVVLALVWMMVQTARASTGWKRRLCWLLFLIPFLLAGATAALIYANHDESGLAF